MEFITAFSRSQQEILNEYIERQMAGQLPIHPLESQQKSQLAKAEIVRSIEEQQGKKQLPSYKQILPRMPQYYYTNTWQSHKDYFYTYTPSGITLLRVPQSQIGHGVLGVAYPGRKLIMVADHLFDLDFEEVKKHELNHIFFPHLTEYEIRQKTKAELPFAARYH
jgi:hypothetical protein